MLVDHYYDGGIGHQGSDKQDQHHTIHKFELLYSHARHERRCVHLSWHSTADDTPLNTPLRSLDCTLKPHKNPDAESNNLPWIISGLDIE